MTPPQRILMTTDAVGGVWTYATVLSRALCERGHEVTLVTIGPRASADQMHTIADLPGLTIETTDLALEWMDHDGGDLPQAQDVLGRIADRMQPDIIHLNSFREATFDFAAPVLVVAHSCVASWWQACHPDRAIEASWQKYLANVAAGLAAATAWVAPTAAYRDWIAATYQPRHGGYVIWNGLMLPPARTQKRSFILAAGRFWDEAKNLSILSQVAPSLDWPVRVAGPTQSVTGLALPSVVDGAVSMLGTLPHSKLIEQMYSASIFVSPALYEPFGLTALEAANCGCALVLSDIPTLRELWDGAALFFDPRDPLSLIQSLQLLCNDNGRRTQLRQASHERSRRYSLCTMADDYCELYRTMQTFPRNDPLARQTGFGEVRA
jgi:glycosyltransferase involved in cell wall biosynthesis